MTTQSKKTASFGFTEVPWEEKADHVRDVFNNVANRYDIMNDLMSAGMHRLWKREMVSEIPLSDGMTLLDVAGGTGDITFRFLERLQKAGKSGSVITCDINAAMLEEGRNRAIDRNILHGIEWLCGNAESLPLPDRAVDAYTIAFGIRNVTDIPAALTEAYRVLKPGSKFLCLEFTPLSSPAIEAGNEDNNSLNDNGMGRNSNLPHETIISRIYDAYSFHVIPRIGEVVTGSADPYRYLVESIRRFPPVDDFAAMIEDAGFSRVSYHKFSAGAVALHSGWRV